MAFADRRQATAVAFSFLVTRLAIRSSLLQIRSSAGSVAHQEWGEVALHNRVHMECVEKRRDTKRNEGCGKFGAWVSNTSLPAQPHPSPTDKYCTRQIRKL